MAAVAYVVESPPEPGVIEDGGAPASIALGEPDGTNGFVVGRAREHGLAVRPCEAVFALLAPSAGGRHG